MKRAAAMTLLPAIILVTLSALVFTAGAACPNVPTMKMDDVCNELRNLEWTHSCWVALNSSSLPKTAELTDYVIMAARHAHLRYEGTLNSVKEMLTAGRRLPGKLREAYTYCRDQYLEALSLMASFDDQLHRCDFTHIPKEDTVGSCADKLRASLLEKMPLYTYDVKDDEILAIVVFELGNMLIGK